MRKKAVSPGHRKALAQAAVKAGLCSGRAACRYLKVSRSGYWYQGKPPSERRKLLMKRIEELSSKHPRYGYRRIVALLKREGWQIGLRTILDEHTRECHVLRADRALRSGDVLEWLGRAVRKHGAPQYLRSDNGPEFIAKEVQKWLKAQCIKTIYIEPGSPWQNGFVESFHGRFRDECLNREQLWTLTEARVVIEDYRRQYNHYRPHSKLGYRSPAHFAATSAAPSSAPVALRAPCTEDGQNQPNTITLNQHAD